VTEDLPAISVPSAPTDGVAPAERQTFQGFVRQSAILTVVMLTSLTGYLTVLKWRGPHARLTTHLSWDELVPYRPDWVWVYLIPYLVGPVLMGLVRRTTFWWYIKRGLVTVVLTLIIFIVLPTRTAPRPSADLGHGPTAWLYETMIQVDDPPANAAPSLHVSLTFLLGLALAGDFRHWRWLIAAGVGLVWLATLVTRQHHLIDVGTGIAMAMLVVAAWPRNWERR
jgi:hypothetical protein